MVVIRLQSPCGHSGKPLAGSSISGRLLKPSACIVAFSRAAPSSSATCAVTMLDEWTKASGTLSEAPKLWLS